MCIIFFHWIAHGNSRYVMFTNELYIYSLWIIFHVFELFKNEFDKNTWLFGLKEQFSRGDFKTVRCVRIIRVFEIKGNLPYIAEMVKLLFLNNLWCDGNYIWQLLSFDDCLLSLCVLWQVTIVYPVYWNKTLILSGLFFFFFFFYLTGKPVTWAVKGSCQFLAKECAQYWLTP